jgi:K+-sensing histidine kinase KdpD
MVDLQLLSVILNNLIDNALKYSPPDSPVNITAETCLRQGQSGIRISVTNQAGTSGLPDPKQLFRKYYRAPGAHGKTGSGLGLHIAAGFARKTGGELRYIPDTANHHHTIEFELWIAH